MRKAPGPEPTLTKKGTDLFVEMGAKAKRLLYSPRAWSVTVACGMIGIAVLFVASNFLMRWRSNGTELALSVATERAPSVRRIDAARTH